MKIYDGWLCSSHNDSSRKYNGALHNKMLAKRWIIHPPMHVKNR